MGSTTRNTDIQSELSYAYVHAVASKIGCSVLPPTRLADNMGIDTIIKVLGTFAKNPIRTDFTIGIQLKSTTQNLNVGKNEKIAFNKLNQNTYNTYRSLERPHPYLVILLQLPKSADEWLNVTPECLILQKCAYWVDLYGAPTTIAKQPTIYFPSQNLFTDKQLENVILKTYAEKKEFGIFYEC
jgi:hypothetical protein